METAKTERELSAEVQSLKQDLSSVKDDLKEITQTLLERGKERARVLKDKLAHAAEATTEKTREVVEKHPLASVGAALGVGLVLGAILGAVLKHRK